MKVEDHDSLQTNYVITVFGTFFLSFHILIS